MPPIGKADQDIVYFEYDIKAKRIKQVSRKIYLYKRADMVGLKDHVMAQFKDAYLSEDHSHMSVNYMWVKFKTLCRGCRKVYSIENGQNKLLCAMDRFNDQTACKEKK